jgi:uncharacterized protein YjbJ (UPF0337 family)
MSNTSQQKSRTSKDFGGSIKREVSRIADERRIEAEGAGSRSKSHGAQARKRLVERAKGKAQQVAGTLEHGVGKAMKKEKLIVQGRAKRVAGEDRQNRNR